MHSRIIKQSMLKQGDRVARVSLKTSVAGITLGGPLYNASGCWCTTEQELCQVLASDSAAAVTKSCTLEPRDGNAKPRLSMFSSQAHGGNGMPRQDHVGSINSTGLANMGLPYYLKFFTGVPFTTSREALQDKTVSNCSFLTHDTRKPVFLSVARIDEPTFVSCLEEISKCTRVCLPEFNIGCPNLADATGSSGSRATDNLDYLRDNIKTIETVYNRPYGLKLSPVFSQGAADAVADVLLEYARNLEYVTCVNSLPNGLLVNVDLETPAIKPRDGYGGIGGVFVLPTALANVRWMYNRLSPSGIDIIGCGGVSTGAHAFAHILCGASAVQVGTALVSEGPSVFGRINDELATLMGSKGYVNLEEFRGKLKGF